MNSLERVLARIEGRETDRIPNLNILMQFAAREIGAEYSKYCRDYKLLAQANILCARKYGIDVVTTMSDPMREAHDFGAEVVFPEDDVPYAKVDFLKDVSDLKKLKPVKPEDGRRMSQSVLAIEYYKKEAGDELAVIGWVEGMFAEAADLRGVNNFLMDLYDEEDFVEDLCETLFQNAVGFARAQVEAGADIIGVGDAISSVAGPNAYRRFAGKYQRKLLAAIKDMGAKTKLHICGNTLPFLDQLPKDVIDILDVDWMVPLEAAVEQLGGSCCLSGNYDPVAIILQGNPETIEQEVRGCAQIGGNKHMSSAGCEIPKHTDPENLMTVKRVLERI